MSFRVVLVAVLLVLAGCSGFGLQEEEEKTATGTTSHSTATPAQAASQPSSVTATPSEQTYVDNPWQRETVTVGLSLADGVQNESRHRAALEQAIRWHNRENTSAYPIQLAVASDEEPDVTVKVQPIIEECSGRTAELTFRFCGPGLEPGDTAPSSETVRVTSVYAQSRTERIYREALAYLTGVSDQDELPGVEYDDERRYYDPFPAHSPVPVNIVNPPDRVNATAQVQRAIDYWESGEGAPYRDYTVEFVVEPNNSDAPLTVEYVETIHSCGRDGPGREYGGCAPILEPNTTVGDDATIEISTKFTAESMQTTLYHEFGHVYGRTHGEAPMPLMNASRGMTRTPMENTSERGQPWTGETLHVYVDSESVSNSGTVSDEVDAAVAYADSGADGHVPSSVDFRLTADPSRANITIEQGHVSDDRASSADTYGKDLDADPALEFYTQMDITVDADIPPDRYAYHVAYWVVIAFVGDADSVPAALDPNDADRTNWENNL